jgi:Leucine-rich repeat (LRR) protein
MHWKYNDLMAWDDTCGDVPNVVALNIADNGLTELPMKIFKLITLKTFYCGSNKLTELPKEIGQLVSLQEFYCYGDQLTELPKEIFTISFFVYIFL